ncbi:hypothetical protein TNCV_4555041 [Trichonephila clavipes]|nr:hypothetical protein TNCV_4555041 [Trichonephila clavipes]
MQLIKYLGIDGDVRLLKLQMKLGLAGKFARSRVCVSSSNVRARGIASFSFAGPEGVESVQAQILPFGVVWKLKEIVVRSGVILV